MSRVIYRLANYDGGMVPDPEKVDKEDEPETPEVEGDDKKKKKKKKSSTSSKQVDKAATLLCK